MIAQTAVTRERRAGLDLIRAAAIAMVVLYHSQPLLTMIRPLGHFWWLEGGKMGVDLFFVLSGFLIGDIVVDTGVRLREPRVLVGFWIGRWLRTLPLYYVFLVINIGVHRAFFRWPFESWPQLTPYLWFTQNFAGTMPPFFFESWSLCVEEWFYLIMPLALWTGLRWGVSFRRCLTTVIIAMVLLPLIFRITAAGMAEFRSVMPNTVIFRLDSIGWGMAAALIRRNHFAAWLRWKGFALVFGMLVTLICYCFWTRVELSALRSAHIILPTLTAVGGACLLPWMASCASLGGGWGERSIIAIARWSYSIYLINIPASVLTYFLVEKHLPRAHLTAMLGVLIYLVGTIILSALSWRLFEKPILSSRKQVALYREASGARAQLP